MYLYNCYTGAPQGYIVYQTTGPGGTASCSYQGGAHTDLWVSAQSGPGFVQLDVLTGPNGVQAILPDSLHGRLSGFSVKATFYTYTG